eukprot:gene3594-20955_t
MWFHTSAVVTGAELLRAGQPAVFRVALDNKHIDAKEHRYKA